MPQHHLLTLSRAARPLGLLLLLFVTMGFALVTWQPGSGTVELPIEVIGAEGHTESVTVQVTDASVDSLYIRGARLGYAFTDYLHANPELYDTKASFRINGGAWVAISNDTFEAFYPERLFTGPTGPIGGPWSVLRGMLPVSDTGSLVVGENTIDFRFNGPKDNETSGYYIVELDLRAHRDAPSALSTTFTSIDYTTWAPPEGYNNSSDIAAGQALWVERNRLVSDPNTNENISAACADCHFHDGTDLKHFNFSNTSVIARSEFHGLSEHEGKQIAAYIRSRDLQYPSGYDAITCGGRPWSLPYQPGPGVNNRPGECWSAGAGPEWVLDTDEEIIPYLFPDDATRATIEGLTEVPKGPEGFAAIHGSPATADLSPSSIRNEVHADSLIRQADVPFAVQFPIIHEWWPRIHPADAVTNADAIWGGDVHNAYEEAKSELASSRQVYIDRQATRRPRDGGTLHDLLSGMNISASNWDWDGASLRGDQNTRLQWYSKSIWLGLKKWELMFSNKLEDLGDEIYRDHPEGLLGGQRLTWHQGGSQVYDMAPHKNTDDNRKPGVGPFSNWRTAQHYSTVWYQMSVLTEANQRGNRGNTSFDANYHHGHIGFQRGNFGWYESLRYLHSAAWLYQMHNNYRGFTNGSWQDPNGWESLHQHWPGRYLFHPSQHSQTPDALLDPIREEMLRQWMRVTMRYDVGQWDAMRGTNPRGDANNWWRDIDDYFTYQPGAQIGSGTNKSQHFLNMVGKAATEHDIAQSLIDTMATWGMQMWPRVADEFGQFHSEGFEQPTLSVTGLANGQSVPADEDLVVSVASSQPLDVLHVYKNGDRIKTVADGDFADINIGAPVEGVTRFAFVGYTGEGVSGIAGPITVVQAAGDLPDGWAAATVQNNFAAADISHDAATSTFAVGRRGEGVLDSRSEDDFAFLFQPLTDHGTVTARIASLPDADHEWRGGGLMIRSTLSVGSPHVSWFFNATENRVRRVQRAALGESNSVTTEFNGIPEWIRIERAGDRVRLYVSADGETWTLESDRFMPSSDIEWVGFYAQNRDHFASGYHWGVDNVSLSGPAFEPPSDDPPSVEELGVSLISPDDGDTFTAPAQLSLEADVTGGDPDDPVALVRFVVDGTVVAEDEDNAYSVTHEISEEGTYTLYAEAETEGGITVLSSDVTITVEADTPSSPPDDPPSLPAIWHHDDVGTVGAPGSASYDDGTYTVSGSGADIWGASDAFHFARQALVGNGQIVARITSQDATDPWAKAGVMLRSSAAADAAHAMAVITPENGLRLQSRPSDGASSADVEMAEEASAPTWVRLTREGTTVSADFSADGASWTTGGSTTVALADTVWAGLAVTSHADGALSTATFTEVSVLPSDVQPIEQIIQLAEGWNFVARIVTPETTSISTLLDAATSEILLVKNEAGAIYSPEFGIDNIGTWASDEAYMVYATEAATLTLTGTPLQIAEEPLDREDAGWAYLPFTPSVSMPVEEALAPVADALLVATDGVGGVYVPEFEINTIGELTPGQGLRAYFTGPVDFTYPVEEQQLKATVTAQSTAGRLPVSSSGAILLIEGLDLPDGHLLAVYGSDDRSVGEGIIAQGRGVLMVQGDDPLTPTVDGARADEPLTVAYETAHGQQVMPLASIANLVGSARDTATNELRYTPGAVWAAQARLLPDLLALEQSYPNPMQTSAEVTFHLPEPAHVDLTLYNALGQRVARLVDEALPAGTHNAVVDGRGLSSGVYFYRLTAGTQQRVHQLLVVR